MKRRTALLEQFLFLRVKQTRFAGRRERRPLRLQRNLPRANFTAFNDFTYRRVNFTLRSKISLPFYGTSP